jgi:DNA-binding response OmpR family regulator
MMLPDINGLQVLQLQKQRPALPVIMLTGLGSESDVVVGLEMGADDYIGKPFNPRVVVARVKAVLRRTGVLAAETPMPRVAGITFDNWTLDTTRCELIDPQRNVVPLTQGNMACCWRLRKMPAGYSAAINCWNSPTAKARRCLTGLSTC